MALATYLGKVAWNVMPRKGFRVLVDFAVEVADNETGDAEAQPVALVLT